MLGKERTQIMQQVLQANHFAGDNRKEANSIGFLGVQCYSLSFLGHEMEILF